MIDNSPFLLGEISGREGKSFFVNFDWVVNATNYQKIIEGNYLKRESNEKPKEFTGSAASLERELKKDK